MGRTIITTCGTSLLSSGCWTLPGIGSLVGLNDDDRAVQEGINKGIIKKQMAPDSSSKRVENKFDNSAWETLARLPDLSAELASLRVYKEALAKQRPSVILGQGDEIVLVHSMNEEGRFCCAVVRMVLIKLFTQVTITTEPISNLDPKDYREFGDALQSIWKVCGDLISSSRARGQDIIFNLTAGYKAVGMALAGLCAFNSAIMPSIIYLHETVRDDSLFVMHFRGGSLQTGYGNSQDGYGCGGILAK